MKGFSLIVVVVSAHIVLGVLALLGGGSFALGATAVERYLAHFAASDGRHFIFSGSVFELKDDLCLQRCAGCEVACFPQSSVKLFCNESCGLYDSAGLNVASEREHFVYVLKESLVIENSTFWCYNRTTGDCGFVIPIGGNYTMSYDIPDYMKPT